MMRLRRRQPKGVGLHGLIGPIHPASRIMEHLWLIQQLHHLPGGGKMQQIRPLE